MNFCKFKNLKKNLNIPILLLSPSVNNSEKKKFEKIISTPDGVTDEISSGIYHTQ